MNTPKIQAILYPSKTYKDGSHPIMIRITNDRQRIYKSVGHSVIPEAWDDENHCVYEKQPRITKRQEGQLNPAKLSELKIRYANAIVLSNAKHINIAISDEINKIEDINQKLKVDEESLDVKNIKTKLNPQKGNGRYKSFMTYGNEMRDKFLKAGSVGTYKRYKTILSKISEFQNGKDLLFSDVTISFLEDYQNHLANLGSSAKTKDNNTQAIKVKPGNSVNTINNNIKTIRAIYYQAIKEQIISPDKNPFFIFKLKIDTKIKKEKLTIEEILAIEKLDLEQGSLLWHCKNFFLFSFYCAGIRASDMLQLKWENVTKMERLEYQMEKTGRHKSISLIPKAKVILNYYHSAKSKPKDFIFPFMDISMNLADKTVLFNQISSRTALINKYLKEIATQADIEKPISTHIARHSFSDIARKKKASIYDISKMLGHSSIKITEAY